VSTSWLVVVWLVVVSLVVGVVAALMFVTYRDDQEGREK
jgi:uncharacterized protein YneF (UPF0154 family)